MRWLFMVPPFLTEFHSVGPLGKAISHPVQSLFENPLSSEIVGSLWKLQWMQLNS